MAMCLGCPGWYIRRGKGFYQVDIAIPEAIVLERSLFSGFEWTGFHFNIKNTGKTKTINFIYKKKILNEENRNMNKKLD